MHAADVSSLLTPQQHLPGNTVAYNPCHAAYATPCRSSPYRTCLRICTRMRLSLLMKVDSARYSASLVLYLMMRLLV